MNIDIADGLTNGAMGTVTNVIIDQTTGKMIVILHKCQELTLSEIVIDMTPAKGRFRPGEAYVAFSRVSTLQKLHIINYT